jgi:uncharacterized protein (DUF736 family)
MSNYDNELRGSLFKNDKDGNEARPDYTGTCQIGGVEYRMAAWLKESANGKKYMSFKFDPKEGGQAAPSKSAPKPQAAVDDSIPF